MFLEVDYHSLLTFSFNLFIFTHSIGCNEICTFLPKVDGKHSFELLHTQRSIKLPRKAKKTTLGTHRRHFSVCNDVLILRICLQWYSYRLLNTGLSYSYKMLILQKMIFF